jgi:hypothetical protein
LKAGCWYEGEIVPNRQRSVRQKNKAQREGTVLRAKNKQYFCDIDHAEQFGFGIWWRIIFQTPSKLWIGIMPKTA